VVHGWRYFPQAFVPTYPLWIWSIPAGRAAELLEQAVTVPGDATERLGAAAREAGVHLAIGVNEVNAEASGTTLYDSILYFDGSGLEVHQTALGRLGGLICWENYMLLARYALYAGGVELYVAPTWDSGEPWLSTLRHIAKEGRVVVGCGNVVRTADVPRPVRLQVGVPRGRGRVAQPG